MATARYAETADEAPATRFVLDSHHLALLDRFVARARRDARRDEEEFTGVVIEIDSARPVVHAGNLKPLVLGEAFEKAGLIIVGPHPRDAES